MDHRLYFVLGDLFANLLAGAIVGLLCWLIVSPGWNMFVAMIVMMMIGMLIATVLWIPCSVLFGAMEVMVPMMLSGMVSGMVISMSLAMEQLSAATCFSFGAICGLASIVVVWVLNSAMRGTEPVRWR